MVTINSALSSPSPSSSLGTRNSELCTHFPPTYSPLGTRNSELCTYFPTQHSALYTQHSLPFCHPQALGNHGHTTTPN
uniref:Uncharacterized protein n=1 Tax=Desertifilum tharense IPPAS B-1220 TaxID=1781255 RepID=A0ACD5GV71_9CYAN